MREVKLTAENGVKVYIDEEVKDWDSSTRRPYYRMRGARISEEQAFEIIRRVDTFFTWCNYSTEEFYKDSIDSMNFNMWWFLSNHSPERYGWVHPDGIVGENGIMQKYPNIEELIEEWTKYVNEFPFLDLVIAITWWDELGTERRSIMDELWILHVDGKISLDDYFQKAYNDLELVDLERIDFENNIVIGVYVHDGVVEIMNKERTVQKYLEYEKLYEEPDSRIYISEYYEKLQPDIVTKDYLFKCVSAYGIDDPEAFIREHYSKNEYEHLLKDE